MININIELDNKKFIYEDLFKTTFTYKQTVFIELGRLFDFLIEKEGYNSAVESLATYATSFCEYAYKNKMNPDLFK